MITYVFDVEKINPFYKDFHNDKDKDIRSWIIIKIFKSCEELNVNFNMINWFHDFKKENLRGTFNIETKHIRVQYDLEIYEQICVFLHELGHAFYYTTKQDTFDDRRKYNSEETITVTHIERMADVLGYTILQNISGEYKLKEMYHSKFLNRKK